MNSFHKNSAFPGFIFAFGTILLLYACFPNKKMSKTLNSATEEVCSCLDQVDENAMYFIFSDAYKSCMDLVDAHIFRDSSHYKKLKKKNADLNPYLFSDFAKSKVRYELLETCPRMSIMQTRMDYDRNNVPPLVEMLSSQICGCVNREQISHEFLQKCAIIGLYDSLLQVTADSIGISPTQQYIFNLSFHATQVVLGTCLSGLDTRFDIPKTSHNRDSLNAYLYDKYIYKYYPFTLAGEFFCNCFVDSGAAFFGEGRCLDEMYKDSVIVKTYEEYNPEYPFIVVPEYKLMPYLYIKCPEFYSFILQNMTTIDDHR